MQAAVCTPIACKQKGGVEELTFGPERVFGRQVRDRWVGAGGLRSASRCPWLGILASEVGGHDFAVAVPCLVAAMPAEVDLPALAIGAAQEHDVGVAGLVVDDRRKLGLLHDSLLM
jgi:hypothetical protein